MKWNSDTDPTVPKGRMLMDRIICDICGSKYEETADRCPVCSYPRQGTEKVAAAAVQTERARVKGGRYSAKNVRKRRKAQRRGEREGSDRGLWITIILLLIAIALVSCYIGLRFWDGRGSFSGSSPKTTQTATQPITTAAPTVPPTVPCTGLTIGNGVVELQEQGQQAQLPVKLTPENTTDVPVFLSADPEIAEVSDSGVVTAIGPGETTITVTCGGRTVECRVICWFLKETTAPSEATEPVSLTLDHTDASLFQPGESFTIKALLGSTYLGRSEVTWTSSDPEIATVEKGVVTAVAPGNATITAQYRGLKAACIVRCQFRDTAWRANVTDVTLAVGDSFQLQVVNNSGETAEVVWSMNADGIVAMEGDTVTGLKTGTVTLSTTVDGVKLWCIVRVK